MKFLHVSDLHIGKRIHERSLLEDQVYMLEQILEIAEKRQIDAVLIAGDIYDKSVPLERGIQLFDEFLTQINRKHIPVLMIAGNHDSGERLDFGARIMESKEVYMAGVYRGELKKVQFTDKYGIVTVYLLPFVKPGHVKPYVDGVETYEDALRVILEREHINTEARNILVAHQFVTSKGVEPMTCESENLSLGGLDNIDANVLRDFDYVALGHLHGAQKIGSEFIRYAGSPLKYSFSEVHHTKSVTVVEMGDKGVIAYELIPIQPLHDMRTIKGPLKELLKEEHYSHGSTQDYMRVILTDEEELFAPMDEVRNVYPNTLRLEFENSRTLHNEEAILTADSVTNKSPLELFGEFYEKQNHTKLEDKQEQFLLKLLEGGERS